MKISLFIIHGTDHIPTRDVSQFRVYGMSIYECFYQCRPSMDFSADVFFIVTAAIYVVLLNFWIDTFTLRDPLTQLDKCSNNW